MLYHYLVLDEDESTHVLSRWESASFYGWTCDMHTAIIYAYTMWWFEGDDYVIRSVDLKDIASFRRHLLLQRYIPNEQYDLHAMQLLLFMQHPYVYCQVMTRVNWDEIDIDGATIREYVESNGIERLLTIYHTLLQFMQRLNDERRLITHVINRVYSSYLPNDDTERDDIVARFNVSWLVDVMYYGEEYVSPRINDINPDFWEHCKLISLEGDEM